MDEQVQAVPTRADGEIRWNKIILGQNIVWIFSKTNDLITNCKRLYACMFLNLELNGL